ncbi:MAG: GC-type dockerin domain-anchored protein [Phycisphaerales bacterium]|jgi:YVTN family beta-propeller protein|nr:GC-type dockerin domain-anchored protein [Phycisphaerales bacterium]
MVRARDVVAACGCVVAGASLAAGQAFGLEPTSATGELASPRMVLPAPQLELNAGAPWETRGGPGVPTVYQPGVPAEGDAPSASRFTPDGSQIIVAHRDTKNLIVYDANTRAFVREIVLSGSPLDLDVSANGMYAVTANGIEDTASIVNLATGVEVATVAVGDTPGIVRITPDSTKAVVGNALSADFSIIDLASKTEVNRWSGGDFSVTLSFAPENSTVEIRYGTFELPDSNTILHPRRFSSQIALIDIDTGTDTTLASAANPAGVALIPGGGTKAYISHASNTRTISVVDLTTKTISQTWSTTTDLTGPIAVEMGGASAVVAVQNAVRFVNMTTGAESTNRNTASVNQIYTTADGFYAICIGFNGSLLQYATQAIVKNTNTLVSASHGSVSPVDQRAAMFSTTFGEDMVVVSTDGPSGGLESFTLSGPEPEVDKPRTVAVSPDGSKAAVVGILSDSVTVYNTATGAVLGRAKTGMRPAEAQFTPDGSKIVVANLDDAFLTIVDTTTFAVTNAPISRRGGIVEISPDSQTAYVPVIADGDGVWRVNLNTGTSFGGKLLTPSASGGMGGVGYLYQQNSGAALSPDGQTFVTANSFENSISIINTATWSVVANVPTGSFPTYVAFSPDSSKIYVSIKNFNTTSGASDRVSVVSNAGAASAVLSNITVGDQPWVLIPTADGQKLYVLNYGSQNIGVVNLNTNTQVSTIPMPNLISDMAYSASANCLVVNTGNSTVTVGNPVGIAFAQDGELNVIDTTTDTVTEIIDVDHVSSDVAIDDDLTVAALPGIFSDEFILVDFTPGCAGDWDNSGGLNSSDFLAYLNDYSAQNPVADLAPPGGDGLFNSSDFLAFLNLYAAGC